MTDTTTKRRNRTAATIPPPLDPLDALVPPEQAAPIAGYGNKKALERDRAAGRGPRYYRINQRVIRYRLGDLLEFRERFRVETAA